MNNLESAKRIKSYLLAKFQSKLQTATMHKKVIFEVKCVCVHVISFAENILELSLPN